MYTSSCTLQYVSYAVELHVFQCMAHNIWWRLHYALLFLLTAIWHCNYLAVRDLVWAFNYCVWVWFWLSLTPPFTSTTVCIRCSASVIVLDHLHAGILRSYSSSISAAERLYQTVRWIRLLLAYLTGVRCVDLPCGLWDVEPHDDADGHGKGTVNESGSETEMEKHGWSSVAWRLSAYRFFQRDVKSLQETYQVAMPVIELKKKVMGPVLTV